MIRFDASSSSRTDVVAAVLAGVGEGAVLCLPVHTAFTGGGGHAAPFLVFVPVFLIAYATAVALICRHRDAPLTGVAVVGIAIGAGALLGRHGLRPDAFSVVILLLLGLRVMSLAYHDWNEPIGTSFLVGSVALGAEVVIGSSPSWTWGPPLVALVPIFFVASLGSRAVSVWMTGDAGEIAIEERAHSLRRALVDTWWIVVAMVTAVGLGVKGGVLDRVGSFLAPIGNALASALVFVFTQLARPMFWLVDRLGIDPEGVRRLFARIQSNADSARDEAARRVGQPSILGRLIGLALFVAIVWGAIRVMRSLRSRPTTPVALREGGSTVEVMSSPLVDPPAPQGRWPRSEPPADRVRRWYADTLTALERRGLAIEPAQTPAEFAPAVSIAYPECAEPFRALTRAYEDVRYGALRIDRAALRQLDTHRRAVLNAVRRQPPEGREPL